MDATIPAAADISGTTLDRMTSAVPPPGVSIADARLEEVADGIFAYIQPDGSWWINNTGFLVGRRGVVSVDACSTERRTRAYLDAIASVTDRPVRLSPSQVENFTRCGLRWMLESAAGVSTPRNSESASRSIASARPLSPSSTEVALYPGSPR